MLHPDFILHAIFTCAIRDPITDDIILKVSHAFEEPFALELMHTCESEDTQSFLRSATLNYLEEISKHDDGNQYRPMPATHSAFGDYAYAPRCRARIGIEGGPLARFSGARITSTMMAWADRGVRITTNKEAGELMKKRLAAVPSIGEENFELEITKMDWRMDLKYGDKGMRL